MRIHICNTFFENELEDSLISKQTKSLISCLRSHPVILQLQFLPLLYADEEDLVLVSDEVTDPDKRLRCLSDFHGNGQIEAWGPSLAIAQWAKSVGVSYEMPPWEVVREINAKIFSFTQSPRLPGAALLANEREVHLWIEKTCGLKVLKTAYGTAGRGHFHWGKGRSLDSYLGRQFSQNLPVIGEPWVERVLDFSTQWIVSREKGEFLGATIIENKPNGSYLATWVGKDFSSYLWALEEHLQAVKPLLKKIGEMGFYGNLGVDSFVYLDKGNEKLHPIVEINGRKTMSWAALAIQRKSFPNCEIRFSFEKHGIGSLPQKIFVEGKEIHFAHQIGIKQSFR